MNKLTFKTFALLATLLMTSMGFTTAAKAADGHLVFNTAAIHFKNFNERNAFVPGIGWEYSPSKKLGFHVGAFSDSFGAQSGYIGLNWGTPPILDGRVRFLLGATAVHKQFHKNKELETKIVPFPVMEISITENASINVTGSPELDFKGSHSNAVMFFQFKWQLR